MSIQINHKKGKEVKKKEKKRGITNINVTFQFVVKKEEKALLMNIN